MILGISRTSKTPTRIYLANRGIKTANIFIVYVLPLPENLVRAENPLIVGLVASLGSLCERHNWSIIDITCFSIEETAAAILALQPKWR